MSTRLLSWQNLPRTRPNVIHNRLRLGLGLHGQKNPEIWPIFSVFYNIKRLLNAEIIFLQPLRRSSHHEKSHPSVAKRHLKLRICRFSGMFSNVTLFHPNILYLQKPPNYHQKLRSNNWKDSQSDIIKRIYKVLILSFNLFVCVRNVNISQSLCFFYTWGIFLPIYPTKTVFITQT